MNILSIMPFGVERQLARRLRIGQIKQLLQEQHAERHGEFLAGASLTGVESGLDGVHRLYPIQILA